MPDFLSRIGPDSPFAHHPDDFFPMVSGVGASDGPMINLPHRGAALNVRCDSCGHEATFSAHQIATEQTDRLGWTVGRFVSALRCTGCGGKRLVGFVLSDSSAETFRNNALEDARIIWARRLNTWLREAGTDIWSFRSIIGGLPGDHELAEAGICRDGA